MKKTAIVTGSSRGIGFAIARQLGLDGYNIVMVATGAQEKNQPALDTLQALGIDCAYVQANIGCTDDRKKILDTALAAFGRLDVLVNNAGVAADGDFHDFDDARMHYIFDTNLIAPFRIARAAIRPMLQQMSGAVVNIGSISGMVANRPQLQVAYNSSKAAIHTMTKTMAFEYAGRGIRVNALAPGYVVSDMTAGGIANADWNRVWTENTPMRRFGQPDEMANCVLFLASDAASYVTGSVLVADGGYLTH